MPSINIISMTPRLSVLPLPLDAGSRPTLTRVGTLFAVDRAYRFALAGDPTGVSNTHEWRCAGRAHDDRPGPSLRASLRGGGGRAPLVSGGPAHDGQPDRSGPQDRPADAGRAPVQSTGCWARRRRTDWAWLYSPSLSASATTAGPVASRAARLKRISEV